MCILVIRSWPCSHSRLTSTDKCMQCISTPGMTENNCPMAHSIYPPDLPTWPCPTCEQFKQLRNQGSVATKRAQDWCRLQALEGPQLDFDDDLSSPDELSQFNKTVRRDSAQCWESMECTPTPLRKAAR